MHTLTESEFLSELAWCILNVGMRERVIRNVFPYIRKCFWDFESASDIYLTGETCVELAMIRFGHARKLKAIVEACGHILSEGGFARFREQITSDPLEACSKFHYIGPVTIWHLLRNIGVDCAKPDRHLQRLAQAVGFSDPQEFCRQVAVQTGERIGVIDMVFWRHQETQCCCLVPVLRRSKQLRFAAKPPQLTPRDNRRPLVCRWTKEV